MHIDKNGKDPQLEHLHLLLNKYAEKKATPEESKELFAILAAGTHDDEIRGLFVERIATTDPMDTYNAADWNGLFKQVKEATALADTPEPTRRLPSRLLTWLSAAAVLLIGVGLFLYNQHEAEQTALALDVLPGKPGATLTLADGTKIALSDAAEGQLAAENGVVIHKTETGELTYELKGATGKSNQLNILATDKGETFRVKLPDGSMVWLNAGSVLTYPSRFDERIRKVEIIGEGYFEIAKATWRYALPSEIAAKVGRDSSGFSRPFFVQANGQEIQVVGTEFNVSAYPDDRYVTTTVAEGSVKVMADEETFGVLKAGKQAISEPGMLTIRQGNVSAVTSWKNGDFVFDNEPLTAIMKKLERWYNVEVSYEGDPTGVTFYGMVSRSKSLRSVLETMEMTGKVTFKIERGNADREERRIVVII